MVDRYNRVINYLRLSVTDRCNLRCLYCMPEEGVTFLPHNEVLTYEEMLRLVVLSVEKGIRKVRLTGGEPLVRRGIVTFAERLRRIEGVEKVALTTNGVLLAKYARDLRNCGIDSVNISMDTMRKDRFCHVTRRDFLGQVWEGIEEAEAAGFRRIKINVVAMKGVNDDEILDFARLTYKKPYCIRFIEMMPVGMGHAWSRDKFLGGDEILDRVRSLGKVAPLPADPLDGPARRYALEGASGEIGVIDALTHRFCHTCNRLRLTSSGGLRGCLFSDNEVDLKAPLREGKSDAYLSDLLDQAIQGKPKGHGVSILQPRACVRSMNGIGG
jgi:cyclic pyranopterin phosphate synthase